MNRSILEKVSPRPASPTPIAVGSRISRNRRASIIADVIGLALIVGWLGWIVHTSRGAPLPLSMLGLAVGCVALLSLSRVAGRIGVWIAPACLVLVASVIVASHPGVFDARPAGGLFGYSNARAAFFVQAAAGSVVLVALWRPLIPRMITLGTAAIFSLVSFWTGTHAGMIAVAGLVVALAASSTRTARLAILLSATAFVLTFSASALLAARYESGPSTGVIERIVQRTPLHEHRVELWHEALTIMLDHPVSGVGPGRFAEVSRLAQEDVDSRYARNEFFQFGAETGFIGLGLLLSLFLWGFLRLLLTPRPNTVTAIAAVALAALGMHACVDYVLHFPAVPLAAAALVGTGIAAGHGNRDE